MVVIVEFSVTMAVVGVSFFFLFKMIYELIIMNAMKNITSFIVVGVMTFVERPASTSAMISHRMRPLAPH